MTTKPSHGPAFKALRTRLGLSPQGLADYLGLTVHAVRKIENGTREPSGPVLRLIQVLGTLEALAPEIHAMLLPHIGKTPTQKKIPQD